MAKHVILYIIKVYILQFIMVVKLLKLDNPKSDLCGIEKHEMEKSAFKVWSL